jgi:hypothetical protein
VLVIQKSCSAMNLHYGAEPCFALWQETGLRRFHAGFEPVLAEKAHGYCVEHIQMSLRAQRSNLYALA